MAKGFLGVVIEPAATVSDPDEEAQFGCFCFGSRRRGRSRRRAFGQRIRLYILGGEDFAGLTDGPFDGSRVLLSARGRVSFRPRVNPVCEYYDWSATETATRAS